MAVYCTQCLFDRKLVASIVLYESIHCMGSTLVHSKTLEGGERVSNLA